MEHVKLVSRGISLLLGAIFVVGTSFGSTNGLLSKAELKELISTAKSSQDHQKLAQHFAAKADELEAESKEHQELAAKYRTHPTMHETKHPGGGDTAGHCQYFADDLHKAAMRARQMATDHREMAKQSK